MSSINVRLETPLTYWQAQALTFAKFANMTPEVSIVIPTFNERDNIRVLIARLEQAMAGVQWEIVFVDDDSPDGTWQVVRKIAASDGRIRLIRRVGRRGLSSACIEGMLSSSAPVVAVMDADLQHDEAILPEMLRKLRAESLDVVVGTRNAVGGSMGEFKAARVRLSNWGKRLADMVTQTSVTDPMSGFFVVRAAYVERVIHRLSQSGFKILLDLLASSGGTARVGEVPYRFRSRLAGESKLDASVLASYIFLLVDKLLGRWIPARFVLFCLVGGVGVLLHLVCLWLLLRLGASFAPAQVGGTFVAMTYNYVLNNSLTFVDRKRKGASWFTGLAIWYLACLFGVFWNEQAAGLLLDKGVSVVVAAVFGLSISAVWNYAVTSVMLWRARRRSAEEQARDAVQLQAL